MKQSAAEGRGIKPLGRVVAPTPRPASIPAIMGTGPIQASKRALEKAGWSKDDLDLVKTGEMFAAQACAVNKALGWDLSKVNVNGGAVRHARLSQSAHTQGSAGASRCSMK